jgi:cytochrome P450
MFRYQAINIYGLQIVSTQTGPEHRRHKNVVKGCFGEAVMQNGFEKMMRAMDTMVREERLENGGKIDVYQPLAVKVSNGWKRAGITMFSH